MGNVIAAGIGNYFDPKTMTDAQLRERLAMGLGATVSGLKDMAQCWRELETRGNDLSELRNGMGRYVALIAAGRLTPEIVVAFLGEPSKIRAVEGLPLARQLAIASGAAVHFYEPTKKTVLEVPLAKLPAENLSYVFRNGRELDASEQAIIQRPIKREPERTAKTVKVDRQSQSIQIGQTTVPVAKIVSALAESAGCKGKIDPNQHARDSRETVVGQVTAEEKQRIEMAAKAAGIPTTEWVRQACMAWLA